MRIVLVGGPLCGKSTYAAEFMEDRVPVYCGDPRSLVREPIPGVIYLPERLGWSTASEYVVEEWFPLPGPWVCEGVSMARALRKWDNRHPLGPAPCDTIVLFKERHPKAPAATDGQLAMQKGVFTVWSEIAKRWRGGGEIIEKGWGDSE